MRFYNGAVTMTHQRNKKSIFPFYVNIQGDLTGTGTLAYQGTTYLSENSGIPSRTIKWRAKNGHIPNTKRLRCPANKNKFVYMWLVEHADEYIAKINNNADLFHAVNDEFYEVEPCQKHDFNSDNLNKD